MNFEIIQNDITNMPFVDAIVLPANEKLKGGSGTSRAIFEKAGRNELTQACNDIGFCETGKSVPTLAFQLDAKYIIHSVVPKWIDGSHQEYDYLSAAYLTALTLAETLSCESIAFPLLASGNNGFNFDLAFEIAKNSIEYFNGSHLKKVFLVVYGNHTANLVKEKGYFVLNLQTMKKESQVSIEDKARKLLEKRIHEVLDYLDDEQNWKNILKAGQQIAMFAMNLSSKNPSLLSFIPHKIPKLKKRK